jgi:hypothetical protein
MLKKTKNILILSLCLFLFSFSEKCLAEQPLIYTIENVTSFEGDQYQEFKDNLLVTLNDGSKWKIHPKDTEKFNLWAKNDPLHIQKRTTKYFFKREHKFEFLNYANEETVRIMLIEYPTRALKISDVQTYLTNQENKLYSWIDVFGFVHYSSFTKNIYERWIELNDGSKWIIKDPELFAYYAEGESVFIGYNTNKSSVNKISFLIAGKERNAVAAWLYPQY